MKIEFDLSTIKITPILDSLKLENLSDEIYFSQKYSDYISNSRLGLLKSKGVEAFFKGLSSNNEYNGSFILGSNLHQLVLQPESYELIDTVFKPTAKAGVMADYLYNSNGTIPTDDDIKSASYKVGYYKDKLTTNRLREFRNKAESYWRDRFIYETNNPFKEGDRERIYTDEKSCDLLKHCLDAVNQNTDFWNLLHPSGLVETPYSANEQTILLDVEAEIPGYEKRIYKLKAKLDNFTIDKEENKITVNDLKTTSKLAKDFDPAYFSYFREIAGYMFLLKLCAKKFFNVENAIPAGNFLVVSTIPDYNTLVYPMDAKMFLNGWREYLFLLRTAIYCNIIKGYEFQRT